MLVRKTKIDGLLVFEPVVHRDARGEFVESFHTERYRLAGIPHGFVQDNYSQSKYGVLRGLHFQDPWPQGKLVYVTRGEVFDVAVDLRRDSRTYLQWVAVRLSESNHHQVYVPQGFAHGFQVLSETAQVVYKCTDFYRPECEQSLRWNDSAIGITWPIANPILSDKDSNAPFLVNVEIEGALAHS